LPRLIDWPILKEPLTPSSSLCIVRSNPLCSYYGRDLIEVMVTLAPVSSVNSWFSNLASLSAFLWLIRSKLTELRDWIEFVVMLGSLLDKNLLRGLAPLGGRAGRRARASCCMLSCSGIVGKSKLPYLDSIACAFLL